MNKKNNKALLPKWRFPEFQDSGEWSTQEFKDIIKIIEERAGTKKYTLMSVTAGVGLVSQIEKFGREIAGNAYKNYYVIQKGDFAYNKSATKQFPEGYIAMLTSHDEVALPNSIFICFRITDENTCPKIFDHLFHVNYHGSWLRKFIAVGARAHGSLNIDTKHLLDMPVILPTFPEQQKISDCLTFLDELITAGAGKLEAYKAHKKGLMQKLFPAEGETMPKWRFPEFLNCGEWEKKTLGNITFKVSIKNNKGISYPIYSINNNVGFLPQSEQFDGMDSNSRGYDISLYKIIERNTFAYNPARINVGSIGYSGELNNIIISSLYVCFKTNEEIDDKLLLHFFSTPIFNQSVNNRVEGGIRNYLFYDNFAKITIQFPKKEEQKIIANCFTSLDKLISAQAQKVDALKAHKKGLIQGLFPTTEEVDV